MSLRRSKNFIEVERALMRSLELQRCFMNFKTRSVDTKEIQRDFLRVVWDDLRENKVSQKGSSETFKGTNHHGVTKDSSNKFGKCNSF